MNEARKHKQFEGMSQPLSLEVLILGVSIYPYCFGNAYA